MQLPHVGRKAFLRITQVAVVLVVLNIVSGAAVRLTDSGLGCPDWPACMRTQITPPLSFHPLVEFGNRMVVVALCVFTALALIAALRRSPRRPDLVWLSVGLVGGVIGEAVIGAVVVYSKLNAYVVMCHFMVGIALLTVALVLALRAGRAAPSGRPVRMVGPLSMRAARLMLGLLALVVAAGTATTGAGPHAGGRGAKRVPVPLEDIVRVHSGIVLVLVGLTLVVLFLLAREGAPPAVLDRARILLGAMIVQGVIGYTQYFTHLPSLLVGVHVFGAAVVWTAMVWFFDGLTRHRPEVVPAGGSAAVAGPAAERPRTVTVSRASAPSGAAPSGAAPLSR